jgi:putative transposase
MTYNPDIHHRRSIRLREYDYSSAGAYFVTICVQNRECLFGDIVDGKLRMNDAGLCIVESLRRIPEYFQHVELDEFVIMPNHLHAIFFINHVHVGAKQGSSASTAFGCVADKGEAGETFASALQNSLPKGTVSGSLSAIVQNFKSVATRRVNKIRNNPGCPVWQRNFYERAIRSDTELNCIREYIVHNPINWADDEENVAIKTASPLDAIVGKYPMMSSSEEFARAKQEEIYLEERKFTRPSSGAKS